MNLEPLRRLLKSLVTHLDKLKFAAEVIGLLVLTWYACTTYRQWQTMDATLKETIKGFRIDERGWVEIDAIKKTVEPPMEGFPQSFKYDVYLKNVGKTKAHNIILRKVTASGGLDFMSNARGIQRTQDDLLKPEPSDAAQIPPYPIPKVIAPNAVTPIPFTLDGAAPQYSNKYYRYPIGRIDYTDDFGIAHWIKFCFVVINATGDLRYCEYGNEEDSNPETPTNN